MLDLGKGNLNNDAQEVEIPEELISSGDLVEDIFGSCLASGEFEQMKNMAILSPYNKEVTKFNNEVISRLPGQEKPFYSFDSVKDDSAYELPVEFLNSIETPDLPPHELKLKPNAIVMLLRNLNVNEGLCNGTRLMITELCDHVIKAKILTGEHADKTVHLSRMTLETSKGLGFVLQRKQFPVRLAYAMTIHKAQGQTLEKVGVDLRLAVFSHGQLYVAFSRVKRQSNLKVLLDAHTNGTTKNVVWKEALLGSESHEAYRIDVDLNDVEEEQINQTDVLYDDFFLSDDDMDAQVDEFF